MDVAGAIGVEDAGEGHSVVSFLWCQTWMAVKVTVENDKYFNFRNF